MSPSVAFPDFSTDRERRVGRSFVCTLQAGEVGPAWVHVAGDLDVKSVPRLERALRHTDTPPRLVVLDLRCLKSIDSAGVELIVDASIRAQRAHRRLMVVRGPPQVDRMLLLSGLSNVVKIVDLDRRESRARAVGLIASSDDAA
jgi:anti-anti-sigma factor